MGGDVRPDNCHLLDSPRDLVKKTFLLSIAGKNPARLLEATKHEIRQYLKRERRKALPEGADYWDFECRFGSDPANAQTAHPANVTALIDAAAQEGAAHFYLELIAKPAARRLQAPDQPAAEAL